MIIKIYETQDEKYKPNYYRNNLNRMVRGDVYTNYCNLNFGQTANLYSKYNGDLDFCFDSIGQCNLFIKDAIIPILLKNTLFRNNFKNVF